MSSFDLRNEPWIPCMTDEVPRSMSLSEVLIESHNVREIVGDSPPITIALHRLLLAILHRVFRGPKNAEAWSELYTRGKFDAEAIKKYFDRHQDRFDLFHDKYPFYQTPSVRHKVKNGAVIQLYFQAKSNATLFDHCSLSVPRTLSPSEAARCLVGIQGFDTAGLITGDNGNDQAKASPLIHSAICLIRGNSLFETLILNLHRYNGIDGQPFEFDEEEDRPAWERANETSKNERWPTGPVDMLTWQSRRIALEPDLSDSGLIVVGKAVTMAGYSFPDAAKFATETMMAFYTKDDGKLAAVRFNEDQALWRNSYSLFDPTRDGRTRIRVLDWIASLKDDRFISKSKLPIDFYGLSYNPKQVAQLVLWNHERFDLPLDFLNNKDLTDDLDKCLKFTEEIGKALRAGVRELILSLAEFADKKRKDKPEAFPAQELFWSQMELRFHILLDRLPTNGETEMREWFADTLETARRSLRDTLNSLSGTAAESKAAVKAENEFWRSIYKAIRRDGNPWQSYLPKQFAAKGGNE